MYYQLKLVGRVVKPILPIRHLAASLVAPHHFDSEKIAFEILRNTGKYQKWFCLNVDCNNSYTKYFIGTNTRFSEEIWKYIIDTQLTTQVGL